MSERNRAREYPPISAIEDLPGEVHRDIDVPPENRVREPIIAAPPPPVLADVSFSPAHPSNRLIAQLNENWRVVHDPLQWILQQRKGNPRKKNSGWQAQVPQAQRRRGTKRLSLPQASNIMAAVAFAREIGTPLNAHATIHWVGTEVGDDPNGERFAKVREGFDKWLKRQGILGGLTAIWVRERKSGGMSEVVHCHMLFHLAHPFFKGRKRIQVESALERLVDRHGNGNYADYTVKLTFPSNPNGLYLLKGGGPDVWRRFGVPSCWRASQGLIFGKRCGTTENIGPAARKRCRDAKLHKETA
jgi:hypothetical protein